MNIYAPDPSNLKNLRPMKRPRLVNAAGPRAGVPDDSLHKWLSDRLQLWGFCSSLYRVSPDCIVCSSIKGRALNDSFALLMSMKTEDVSSPL